MNADTETPVMVVANAPVVQPSTMDATALTTSTLCMGDAKAQTMNMAVVPRAVVAWAWYPVSTGPERV